MAAFLLAALLLFRPLAAAAEPVRLMALGDSLVAGYGLPAAQIFTAQLEAALRDAGYDVVVLNAGVSGDTTAGGLARLEWALGDKPDLALVELGANDGLRGLDPADSRANLADILATLHDRGIPTLLAGMMAPPNLGRAYGTQFNGMYAELAAEYDTLLYPFFLDGVVTDQALNQEDGIHPNAAGVAEIVRRMLPSVLQLIEQSGFGDRRLAS